MKQSHGLVLEVLEPYALVDYDIPQWLGVIEAVEKSGGFADLDDSINDILVFAKKGFASRSEAAKYAAHVRWMSHVSAVNAGGAKSGGARIHATQTKGGTVIDRDLGDAHKHGRDFSKVDIYGVSKYADGYYAHFSQPKGAVKVGPFDTADGVKLWAKDNLMAGAKGTSLDSSFSDKPKKFEDVRMWWDW